MAGRSDALVVIGFQHRLHSCRCSHSLFEVGITRVELCGSPEQEVRFFSLALINAALLADVNIPKAGLVGRAGRRPGLTYASTGDW